MAKKTTSVNPGTKAFAADLDRKDALNHFRGMFFLPQQKGRTITYFCGHSLGAMPREAVVNTMAHFQDWANMGVEGHWNAKEPWVDYHLNFAEGLSQLIGAKAKEVVAMNSLTVNIHVVLASLYKPEKKRFKILTEANGFGSDRYALESMAELKGQNKAKVLLNIEPEGSDIRLDTKMVLNAIEKHKDELAMIWLSPVHYLTGQLLDIKKIAKEAKDNGIPLVLDLAHTIGNVPLQLHKWGVDAAVWCSYKYLNGGPGAVGGLYLHEQHANNKDMQRLAGWWGQQSKDRFAMPASFTPEKGIDGWQLSNAPIFNMQGLKASLSIFEEAGMKAIRKKSEALTGYLEFLLHEFCHTDEVKSYQFRIITPPYPEQRGAQLSLKVDRKGKELATQLEKGGFKVDFRSPDIIRVAPAPLYNTFSEVQSFAVYLSHYAALMHG